MRSSRLIAPLVLLAAAPFLLAACGDSGSDDEDQITEVIETSVETTDPADCTEIQTQRFVEQTNFAVGEAAVAACEEDVADTSNDPDSVEVSEVVVDGDTATADVSFSGGSLDGSVVSVALVKDGDQWKLDQMTEIQNLNLEAFKSDFTSQFEDQEDIPAQVRECIVGEVNAATEAEVTQTLLSGKQEDLVALLGDCVPG